MDIKVLILTGYGINAEKELAWAFEKANGNADIIHLDDVLSNKSLLKKYQILAFPGGFSYGDHIASGRVFSNIIKYNLMDEIKEFIDEKKLIIGICNGFQIITQLGLVPDLCNDKKQTVSLIQNDSGHFEDRWVWVRAPKNNSPWLVDIDKLYLPVRHGEGKLVVSDQKILQLIIDNNQIALQYIDPDSKDLDNVKYPFNPNGSIMNIAGILNKHGNVFGLMPHPEAYIFEENHPRWTENIKDVKYIGLKIFENAIDHFK